jgi:hypothetical protein
MTEPPSGSSWADELSPGQLAMSRSVQMGGLTGHWSGSIFTWLLNDEPQATSEAHDNLSDAFDEAFSRLPAQFRQ